MSTKKWVAYTSVMVLVLAFFTYVLSYTNIFAIEYRSMTADVSEQFIPLPELDKDDYNARLLALAHVSTSTPVSSTATTSIRIATTTSLRWPVSTVYPNAGALLPFKRVVAYYGNFYSKGMGVLGEYPTDEMLAMLASTTA